MLNERGQKRDGIEHAGPGCAREDGSHRGCAKVDRSGL